MPRVTWSQHNFNGGEWSPLAYGRSDIAKYKNGLALCKNYVPLAQGGLTRRPGTAYVANVKNSAARVRLIPFEYSITQAYVLEFGNNYIRFFTNDGQLQSAPNVAYEVATTYTTAELDDISFTQSADVLYIVHPNHPPAKLVRNGSLSWTLSDIVFTDGPYLAINTVGTTLQLAAFASPTTLTASATTGINGGAGFVASDVGRLVRLQIGTQWCAVQITAIGSTTSVTVNYVAFPVFWVLGPPAFPATTGIWRLGLFYIGNYPRAVGFHQDRLCFAGAAAYSNRIDGSVTSSYENFSPSALSDGTVVDSNAWSFTLNARSVNQVYWLVSDEWGLLAGTASSEWVLAPSTAQTALTPTNVTAKQITHYGSTSIVPQRIGKSTLFVQRAKRKLREITYQFTLGTFQAPDISLVSEHLTKGGLRQMTVAQQPYPIVWKCRIDGTLVGLSYDKDQEVNAWHQHALGGYSDAGRTLPPVVESVCAIPAPNIDRDELWLVAQRYINGATVRTVERLTKYWEDGDAVADSFFVDCGATYSGAPTTTVSGLTWLPGETVKVLADGAVHPDCVVSAGGAITLSRQASKVSVGLGYASEGRTLPIDAGGAEGSAQGKLKRIHRMLMRFFQSVGLKLQGDTNRAPYAVPFRTGAHDLGQPVPLFNGWKDQRWEGTYGPDAQIYFEQTDPLPQNITMLSAQLETQDGG